MKIEICPVCGSPIEHIELTTLPPIPIKQCLACGWRWEGKQEAVEYVTFKDETDIKVKKAIDLLSEKRNLTRKLQEGWKNAEYCPPEGTVGSAGLFYNQHKEYANALDLALTALRSMPEAGEPLSLEQLREMHGKPVYEFSEKRWFVVKEVFTKGKPKGNKYDYAEITMTDGTIFNSDLDYDEISNRFYSYPPAYIDRSKWTAKNMTDQHPVDQFICSECGAIFEDFSLCKIDEDSGDKEYCEYELKFCPACGRAISEEAWAKLERRLRG